MNDENPYRELAHAVVLQLLDDARWVERATPPSTVAQKRREREAWMNRREAIRWFLDPDLSRNLWVQMTIPEHLSLDEWVAHLQNAALHPAPRPN